jgi:aryl-alcohol dehydrogenase-like predicted oxidoreductase
MEKRRLGRSDLEVAPLAFGGNVFGWTADEATSFRLLDAFTDAGFNLVDTADVYSNWVPGHQGGESETIVGRWLKKSGKRSQVVLATKVGGKMSPEHRGLSRAYIRSAVEDSLRRLQTDVIDLYQSHYDDPATPMEETLETYAQLVQEGKVRVIGASNFSNSRLKEALLLSERHGWPRYESLQPEYNLYDRHDFEHRLEPLCVENKVGVINYYALASGFLTGKYRSEADLKKSPRGPGIQQKYLNERGYRILAALDEVAAQYHTDPASIALAWLIARRSITAAIASATTTDQLAALVKATDLQLDMAAIDRLNHASNN